MLREEYSRARRLGEKAYHKAVASKKYPYLPALDGLLRNRDSMTEEPMGICEIPLSLVFGTLTQGRQQAFASNYMPLLSPESEFAAKWMNVLAWQTEDGIQDAIRVYEFMGKFYVIEGNKRVSVMRYLGQPSIDAEVTRLVPPHEDSRDMRIYEEFLQFYKSTAMYELTFSEEGCYDLLAEFLGMHLDAPWPELVVQELKSAYAVFERIYLQRKGDALHMTTGDAFLIYLRKYHMSSLLDEPDREISRRMADLWKEYRSKSQENDRQDSENASESGQKKLHAKSIVADGKRKVAETISHVIPHRGHTE